MRHPCACLDTPPYHHRVWQCLYSIVRLAQSHSTDRSDAIVIAASVLSINISSWCCARNSWFSRGSSSADALRMEKDRLESPTGHVLQLITIVSSILICCVLRCGCVVDLSEIFSSKVEEGCWSPMTNSPLKRQWWRHSWWWTTLWCNHHHHMLKNQ